MSVPYSLAEFQFPFLFPGSLWQFFRVKMLRMTLSKSIGLFLNAPLEAVIHTDVVAR